MSSDPCSLQMITTRKIAIELFRTNIRWRRISDVAYSLRDILEEWKISPRIVIQLRESLAHVLREVRRWDDKHSEMFVQGGARRIMNKSEHLRTFYSHLIWKYDKLEIDDMASAMHLMKTECKNWPLMQFQLSCLYAITEWIQDDWKFDKYRRITFKKQLEDHPVYDFWLTLLDSRSDIFFDTERRLPNQKLTQCFVFAITHGYFQLTKYIWNRIGNGHRESVGLLQWRAMCFRARDADTMRFLCNELCILNPTAMTRISWTAFFDTFYMSLNKEESDIVVEKKFRRKFEFLLDNCCPQLRRRLLKMENCRVVSDAFRYNRVDLFAMILDHLDGEELRNAREIVDRIHDRHPNKNAEYLRRAMMRKQMTID